MTALLLQGDCRDVMEWCLPDECVQTCVTSPPYFGLRDYGHGGQIGLEKTPAEFVDAMVAVFREVRRVLRDDGTLWLNLGDSYATSSSYNAPRTSGGEFGRVEGARQPRAPIPDGLKPKDLIGIPWRVAFALQADGWYLRQDIIWSKPNPMPESVADRCTKAHEYMFLFSKSPRYYFDHEAIKEPAVGALAGNIKPVRGSEKTEHRTRAGLHDWAGRQRSKRDSFKRDGSKREQAIPGQAVGTHRPDRDESDWPLETRNKRSVWTVATRGFKGAHFATYPPDLIEPCILAGSQPGALVLDPFNGSGTTGAVAMKHGRQYVGIELNPAYLALTRDRFAAAEQHA